RQEAVDAASAAMWAAYTNLPFPQPHTAEVSTQADAVDGRFVDMAAAPVPVPNAVPLRSQPGLRIEVTHGRVATIRIYGGFGRHSGR
ncbi:hypothetical protein KEM55_003045, partial [Ascosphaera atra]